MTKRYYLNLLFIFGLGVLCDRFFSYYMEKSMYNYPSMVMGSSRTEIFSHKDIEESLGPDTPLSTHSDSEIYHKGESEEAIRLAKKIRVLCWVLTKPENHKKKAIHVKATWGKRCNKLIFMSSEEDKDLGAISLNIQEGRNYLWAKTKAAFTYVYENHFDDADWFMKADDDTYVILENLRYMLGSFNSSDPLYFGCRFRPFAKQGYMSGGAGYVLSKDAVRKFVEEALPNHRLCKRSPHGAEDAEMGKCLERVGVKAIDSRDNLGRRRFFPFAPGSHIAPGVISAPKWYWDYIFYPVIPGLDCCSDTAISFHYIPPNKLYELEYLIYHLRPYGITFQSPFPAPLPEDKNGIPEHATDSDSVCSLYLIVFLVLSLCSVLVPLSCKLFPPREDPAVFIPLNAQ